MAALRDQAARRRLELNPIRTTLNVGQQPYHLQTPSSALSSNSLSAPFGYNSANYTPVSGVQQYNPQQWTASPNTTPESGPRFLSNQLRDGEVVTPAPPPYSPPRSQRTSQVAAEEPSSSISPATRVSPSNLYRSSPEPSSNPVFPPPPSTRARAGSSDRPLSLFGISAFTRRTTAPDIPRAVQDVNREQHTAGPRRPVPISIEAPSSESDQSQLDSRPPASRRAASTGAISTPSTHSRASSTTRWEPGMPLPPPPPGPPPPPQPRSQSMNRSSDNRLASPPSRRPGPMSSLGPVPPTPAGWTDEDAIPSGRGRSPNPGLSIDTSSSSVSSSMLNPESNSGSSTSGLSRARAIRGEPKSIRERRNESKTRRVSEASNNPWADSITPADIVVPPVTIPGQRPVVSRTTPSSARSHHVETPGSVDGSQQHTPVQVQTAGSKGSTPRPQLSSSRPEAPTPPFSPGQIRQAFVESSPAVPPKGLPTPPPQRSNITSPVRPVSHILHIPHEDTTAIPPLLPSRPGSRQSNTREQISTADHFTRAAIERHQAFIQKEAAAATDSERVRIFADFIVTESRLRRDRYATAIDAMGSEILELTRDLFRPYNSPSRRPSESNMSHSSGWTPESSTGARSPVPLALRSHRGSLSTALHDIPPLNTGQPSSDSMPGSPIPNTRPETTWWTGYMPSLSPIPSMSVSEAPDGSDSRGRPSSRWWEVSQEGSTGTPSMRLERSKRESKYMGMPKELREALQNGEIASPTAPTGNGFGEPGPSNSQAYGSNEYPPEKVGWHEQNPSSPPMQSPHKSPVPFSPALLTPNPDHLDVSRLVTLPPPYPRHHPAVNNNHPDLTSIRTLVRSLSDFTEVEATKARFLANSKKISEDFAAETSKRRNSLRANIQRGISSGSMSYADAAKIEAEALLSGAEKTKEASKADFELFQSQVVIPLNDLLMDRVHRSTELFAQLRSKLFVDAQEQSPNLTQEEGDEQPELLEKLTLLKWIFETREQLHRELFDLLSDRNDRYKEMVITPYRLAGNVGKTEHAEKFFADDAAKRQLQFSQEVLKRTEEFLDIIEENVVRGVEVQLSAFWDIAPSLSTILSKIPQHLSPSFQIQIPPREYEENESYFEHPLQYLYSLLGHCEKSSRQFIESQVNLLCLLHEVKGGVTAANCRVVEKQRIGQGEDKNEVEIEMKGVEADEEGRLTDDLKERVRCVEEQWGSALGKEIERARDRVRNYLSETGGWDEESSL